MGILRCKPSHMGVGSIFPKVLFTPTKPEGMITRGLPMKNTRSMSMGKTTRYGIDLKPSVFTFFIFYPSMLLLYTLGNFLKPRYYNLLWCCR